MIEQRFGGSWTDNKLDKLRRYLVEYTKIFSKASGARRFFTMYVDAFAGTGYRTRRQETDSGLPLFPEHEDADAVRFLEGSVSLALSLKHGFDRYVFIEIDPQKVNELKDLSTKYPGRNIVIKTGDANVQIPTLCSQTDWRNHRAVVFLDPYAMEVNWKTITSLGQTKAVDLWLLFPLSAVNRLLTRHGPPPDSWADHLTRVFGTEDWRNAFYHCTASETLFGPEERQLKQADFDTIGQFFVRRLETVFAKVAPHPRVLFNSRNVPLFLLCFAAANPHKGGDIALRIAEHILNM